MLAKILPFSFMLFGCSVILTEAQTSSIGTGLIRYYKFEGNSFDSSPADVSGLFKNGASFGVDRFGRPFNALQLDGIDDRVTMVQPLPDLSEMTICTWIRPEISGRHMQIFSDSTSASGNDVEFFVFEFANIGIASTKPPSNNELTDAFSPTNSLVANEWTHVAWTMRPTKSQIFINGILQGSFNKPATDIGNHGVGTIGAQDHSGKIDKFFKGGIDEFRIYNRALSDAEVLAVVEFEKPGISLTAEKALRLSFNGLLPGASYDLEKTTSIKDQAWTVESTFTAVGQTHSQFVVVENWNTFWRLKRH